jgi:ParB-like chromosome segregation protein Spo0J
MPLQLASLPVEKLLPAPYNPRKPLRPGDAGWRKLERSLREFDLVQPIVWNRQTGHVVGGHQRLEVLKHQGRTEIDCLVVDLPLEREKLLNVALNNREVGSDWDPDKLISLLDELVDLPEVDATLTGFDPDELRDLLLTPEPESVPDESTADADDLLRVQLEIPLADWPALEHELNRLLASYPEIRLHRLQPDKANSHRH